MSPAAGEEEPKSGKFLRRVGPYRLLESIGMGASGVVYRAEHIELKRQVALKFLRPELTKSRGCVQRFYDEARVANLIDNDHIVQVTDLHHTADGTAFFVMELLEGESLASLMERTPLSVRDCLSVVLQLAETMADVHAANVIHRDLKPENVFVTWRQGEPFVKLLDFGIAKRSARLGTRRATRPGVLIGTPLYMAPEQAMADPIDHRCDIHAIGAILFELLTGREAFSGATTRELLANIAVTVPPRVTACVSLPSSIREALDALVAGCLQKEPDHRPQTAGEVAQRITAMLEVLPKVRGVGTTQERVGEPSLQPLGESGAGLEADVGDPFPPPVHQAPSHPPLPGRSRLSRARLGWAAALAALAGLVGHSLWSEAEGQGRGLSKVESVSAAVRDEGRVVAHPTERTEWVPLAEEPAERSGRDGEAGTWTPKPTFIRGMEVRVEPLAPPPAGPDEGEDVASSSHERSRKDDGKGERGAVGSQARRRRAWPAESQPESDTPSTTSIARDAVMNPFAGR